MKDADKILREQTIPALRGSGGDGHADAIEHVLAEVVRLRAIVADAGCVYPEEIQKERDEVARKIGEGIL